MNRRASLWKYVKIGGRWKFCRPAIGRNNKVKPDWVRVGTKDEHHPEGNYYVQHIEHGKQVWKNVGNDCTIAVRAADFQAGLLQAVARGVPVKDVERPLMIAYTLPNYLEEYRLSHRPQSYAFMKQTLEEFVIFVRKNIIGQITRWLPARLPPSERVWASTSRGCSPDAEAL